MNSLNSAYGFSPGFFEEMEALVNESQNGAVGSMAVPERRGSMGRFVLSPLEKSRPMSPIVRATSTVALSAMPLDPSSVRSSAGSAFPLESTERPALLVGRGIDPDGQVFRPLPGYRDWIEHSALNTPVVEVMKTEIETVKKLVLSRGVSLHEISAAVQGGTCLQELAAERAKRVTFAPQIEEVIPDVKNGCCVVQ
ncbi:MAG: hypothetical protein NTX49_02770 [Chlamydiae bacterium]|nr:hypothetical protein [Chlamydiota bacterium]